MGAETDLIIRTAPLIMLVALMTGTVGAFSVSPGIAGSAQVRNDIGSRSNHRSHHDSNGRNKRMRSIHSLRMAPSADDNDRDGAAATDQSQQDRLAALGYSPAEISRSQSKGDDAAPPPGEQEVFVEEFEVDAATLTAVGFGLIAFNFLVLANMGDGGIGGVVASLINSSRY